MIKSTLTYFDIEKMKSQQKLCDLDIIIKHGMFPNEIHICSRMVFKSNIYFSGEGISSFENIAFNFRSAEKKNLSKIVILIKLQKLYQYYKAKTCS